MTKDDDIIDDADVESVNSVKQPEPQWTESAVASDATTASHTTNVVRVAVDARGPGVWCGRTDVHLRGVRVERGERSDR
jgi:hypothetical protein